jgi:hypothetical protein
VKPIPEKPALCPVCALYPPDRYYHGGQTWLCMECDLPIGAEISRNKPEWDRLINQALGRPSDWKPSL